MKKRILFVDDDEDILFCYRLAVESEKAVIHTASDVESALNIVRQTKIDVAVLDYMMPGLKGDELARQINQIDPEVRIYFISGYDIALEAVRRLDVLVYGVFMKPVDPELLRQIANTEEYASTGYQAISSDLGNLYSNISII
jgi:DNA-binding NtrC family response regulator